MRRLFSFVAPLLFLAAASAPAQVIDKNPEAKKEVLERISEVLTRNAFVPGIDFSKWPEFLKAEQPQIDKADTDESFQRSINTALRKFGASHIQVSTPKSATGRREAKTTGIGISAFPEKDSVLITYVFEGSPAALVGLQAGDRIVAVNGEKVSDGVKSVAGDEGTSVTITVKKLDGEEQEITVTRKKYSTVRPEELRLLDEETAMLTVHTFDLTYNAERVETLLKKVGTRKNLILDLRSNGGGAVYNLQHLLGCFLPADAEIGTFISRRVVEDYRKQTGNYGTNLTEIAKWAPRKVRVGRKPSIPRFTGNVAVLVNNGSGSASEIAAAALRDLRSAPVVGSKTAGAVLVSVIAPVGEGFTLQYPLSDYVTIQGKRLEGEGVTPDHVVEMPPFRIPSVPDLAVSKAVDLLRELALKRS